MTTTAEQIQQTVQRALREFEELVVSERPPSEVLQSMVRSLSRATEAVGAVAWMPADQAGENYSPVARHGRGAALALDEEGEPRAAVHQAIRNTVGSGKPVIVSPDQEEFRGTELQGATQLYVPIEAMGRVSGAVLVICPAELDPKVYRQYVAFIQQGARAAGMYLARRHSQVLQEDAASQQGMLRITHHLLELETAKDLVHELANQARTLLKAQRVAVVGYRRRRTEVAFSDAVNTNRKAVLVRSVEMLADAVRERQVPMTFTKDQPIEGEDEALAPLLDEVYSLGNARALCLTPIRSGEKIVGVVVGEYEEPEQASRRAGTQQELAHQVGPILDQVIQRQQRPLRRTSNLLAKLHARPKSFALRAAVAAATIAALVYLLFFMPVAIPVYGDARLEPAQLAVMASPQAGRVEEVLVETGERIASGQPVALMDRTDLRMEMAEVDKAIETERVKLNAARAEGGRGAQADIAAAKLEVERLRVRRESVQRKIERARVRSLIDGVVLTERPDRMEGRTIPEGEPIIQAADLSHFDLVIEVREEDLALVEEALRDQRPVPAAFLSRAWPDQTQKTVIREVAAVSPTSAPGEQGQQHVFKISVPVDLEGMSPQLILANPTGRAKLHVGTGSVAYRYGRRVWRFLQMTVLF